VGATGLVSYMKAYLLFYSHRLSEANSQFVGAWWLGLVVFGGITIVAGIPILWFPRVLPDTEEVRKNRQNEMHQDRLSKEITENENIGTRFVVCLNIYTLHYHITMEKLKI